MLLLLVKASFCLSFCDVAVVAVAVVYVVVVVVVADAVLQNIFRDLFPSFSFRQYINYWVTFPVRCKMSNFEQKILLFCFFCS